MTKSIINKWYLVEGVEIDDDMDVVAEKAFGVWQRKHTEKPDAIFVQNPWTDEWNGLKVMQEDEVPAGLLYIGRMR